MLHSKQQYAKNYVKATCGHSEQVVAAVMGTLLQHAAALLEWDIFRECTKFVG